MTPHLSSRRWNWITLFTCVAALCVQGQPGTFHSLLSEMADLDALARFPSPEYRQGQGSTYNRASVSHDQPDQSFSGWFGDSDGVYYIRTETTNSGGLKEYVVMEHFGPGAITKLWTPFFYRDFNNRSGPNIRVYLNGSNTPMLDENLIELVTRLEWSTAEYGAKPAPRNSFTLPPPLANFTARAGNCYLPIPFAQSCKVTITGEPFYDIVSYRAYPAGTTVENFSLAAFNSETNQAQLTETISKLTHPQDFSGGQLFQRTATLASGDSLALSLNNGPSAVRHLEIQLDPAELRTNSAALRATVLLMTFDGQQTVWCPLGDFFCSPDELHPLETWTRSVTTNNAVMVCRWVMPYQDGATIALTNAGPAPVTARVAVRTGAWQWDANSMHFHANWRPDDAHPGTPPSDWNFIDVRGKGVFVGDVWTVLNIQPGTWWGEGDEKIYVDSEYDGAKFPGIFGTGTEDYYGWAGGVVPTRTDEFQHPYLANVRVGGLDGYTLGFNINTRVRGLDAIPFHERLRFDMESSFGTDIRNPWNLLGYSAVTFWYAVPGATDTRPPQPAAAARPIQTVAELQRQSDAIRSPPISERAIAFYYPWYGNPEVDGRYANWNHPVAVRNEPPRSFPGGDDIGANFYPALGCYSSNDPKTIIEHMRQLRQAGVGAISVSWWGTNTYTDRALPGLFKAAEQVGLKINFHIEPFPGRNGETTREAIIYLLKKFGASPACHRLATHDNWPVFFLYDSYLTPASDWAKVLSHDGSDTIRGTAADAVVIALWVKENEASFMLEGGFDGFYTYFATDGFTYGSTTANWPKLAEWARANRKLFVPCVAPGYIDTRIRPWNNMNTRDREQGAYYDRMWASALKISPELVAITSFNEWHEGTQIEPAVPKQIENFKYLNYEPLPQDYYLDRTAHWVRTLESK